MLSREKASEAEKKLHPLWSQHEFKDGEHSFFSFSPHSQYRQGAGSRSSEKLAFNLVRHDCTDGGKYVWVSRH